MEKFKCPCCGGNFEVEDDVDQKVIDLIPENHVQVCSTCAEEIIQYQESLR